MYREVAQWRHVRRSILEKGTPKKQVARDTGISRRVINKMLMHENPPRYGPRPPLYPKLGPYISAIDELISSAAADLTIRDIVARLRREHGFAGSYDSVRNYVRHRVRYDDKAWDRAYELIVRLPKARAVDLIRLLSRGNPLILLPPAFEPSSARPQALANLQSAPSGGASRTPDGYGGSFRRRSMTRHSIRSSTLSQTSASC